MRQAIRRDAYEVIGVRPDASDLEIKRAFRERAKAMHPDANGGRTDQEFLRLVEAYRQTDIGRAAEQPLLATPPTLKRRVLQTCIDKKWYLLWGAMALALYVRAQSPPEEPVTRNEPIKIAAQSQKPQNAEPGWATRYPLVGYSSPKQATRFVLARSEPQLSEAFRRLGAKDLALDRTGQSVDQITASLPAAPPDLRRAATSKPGAFVDVMPVRRPKHLGETTKRHHKSSKGMDRFAKREVPIPDTSPTPRTSVLDRLPALLGLQ